MLVLGSGLRVRAPLGYMLGLSSFWCARVSVRVRVSNILILVC